jgi:hypothetical protein
MKHLSKLLLLFTALFLLESTVHAQNAIAKINYEQAEEAFDKNNYTLALAKLDQAQKILGNTNPKILYLRLMAAKAIMATQKFDWEFLAEARTNAAFYLKNYSELAGIEEKLRQVYEFSETLEAFPKTKELWEEKRSQAEQAHTEWLKQRPVQVSDSLMKAYGVNECRTIGEFLNSRFAPNLKKSKGSSKYATIYAGYPPSGPHEVRFDEKGRCIYFSCHVLAHTADTSAATKVYNALLDLYPAELAKEWVERKELTRDNQFYETASLTVRSPATGDKGYFTILYMKLSDGASVSFIFYPKL